MHDSLMKKIAVEPDYVYCHILYVNGYLWIGLYVYGNVIDIYNILPNNIFIQNKEI